MGWDSNRRQVLGGAAAALATAGLGGAAFAKPRPYRVGVVGSGWFGQLNAHALMQVAPAEVIAMCDVDSRILHDAANWIMAMPDSVARPTRRPQLYHDYRTMLAKHHFDIVIVATPDHWHALPGIAAMKAGAHVYLEKPVSVDVVEGQALLATARATGRVVQVGTQRRNSPCHIEARDRVIREGRLGKVGLIELFSDQRPKIFPPPSPPPAGMDWDFYCGPAAVVPYREGIHPRAWRAFREFGNGSIGDIGVHFMDLSRFLLGLGAPTRISAIGGDFIDKSAPSTLSDTMSAQIEFDDLVMNWTNRQWGDTSDAFKGWSAILYGEKGTLKTSWNNYEFVPLDKNEPHTAGRLDPEFGKFPHDRALDNSDQTLTPLTRYNMLDFLAAIETGKRPAADIEQGVISSSCAILANLSADIGRSIRWDAGQQRAIGDEEAQSKLARPYRAPWVHPAATG